MQHIFECDIIIVAGFFAAGRGGGCTTINSPGIGGLPNSWYRLVKLANHPSVQKTNKQIEQNLLSKCDCIDQTTSPLISHSRSTWGTCMR